MKSSSLEIWEAMAKNPVGGYKEGLSKEKEFLLKNLPENSVVLDIGSGFGRVLEILALKAKKIVGIDNDEEAVEKSKEFNKGSDNVKILLGDAEDLKFEDGEFDVVTCLGGTPSNFGKTRNKIYSEIKRILREEGIFFCSVYNEDALEERLSYYDKCYSGKYSVNKETGYVEIFEMFVSEQFSKEQITKILEENGFKILEIIKEGVLYIIKAKKKENDN